MTKTMRDEFTMVKRAITILERNKLRKGDLFSERQYIARHIFYGYKYVPQATLDALERRGIVSIVEKKLIWADTGEEVSPTNLRVGKIVNSNIYKVNIDNFADWLEDFGLQIQYEK